MTKAELIAENRYMVLSTADPLGRPWASPVWFAPDGEDGFLWISRPDTRHSLNIAERPEIAIVIFDSSKPPAERQALYVEAVAEEVGPDPGLVAAYSGYSIAQGLDEDYPPALRHLASFPKGDQAVLAQRLNEILGLAESDRAALRTAARQAAVERWSWTNVARRILAAAEG